MTLRLWNELPAEFFPRSFYRTGFFKKGVYKFLKGRHAYVTLLELQASIGYGNHLRVVRKLVCHRRGIKKKVYLLLPLYFQLYLDTAELSIAITATF
jgi:hypothetical protein